jgi:CHASE2 domain-containing sensor protein
MSKLVVLNLGKGNLQDGFPFVNVRLETGDKILQLTGSLPPASELRDLYDRWQSIYNLLYQVRSFNTRRLETREQDDLDDDDDLIIDETSVTHISDRDFDLTCDDLRHKIDSWFDSESFRAIDRQLRQHLNPSDEIRFILQSEDIELSKLPWYTWQFFQDYPKAEIALSRLNFEFRTKNNSKTEKVRILAILGDSTGIDVSSDRQLLESLPGADVTFLVEPTRQLLDERLWDSQGWNILFFAGHSSTDNSLGRIYLNAKESITVPQLKNALNKAIERGLQFAIFNSCQGIGLAEQLSDLHIPQTIVMREPVSDRVAQEFLKYFLTSFADGQPFYLAVREARERLQGMEGNFPGASWLPVIFQNPAEIPATWQQLQQITLPSPQRSPTIVSARPKLATIFLASIAVTTAIAGVRWLGFLQDWELKAFDSITRSQPVETGDKRLLIVAADEEDLDRYGYPLPDKTLVQLLNKLQQHQPAAVGLDIFRDRKNQTSDRQALTQYFQKHENAIAICAGNNLKDSTAALLQVPERQIGFVDLYWDKDNTVRRYSLSRSPNPISKPSRCKTPYSFGWQLAYKYLTAKGIPVTTVEKDWKFGDVVFPRLQSRNGGYQTLEARSNQMLLSYRNTPQIAQQVTIRDILEDSVNFDRAWIKDRVVLIGVTAASVPDTHDTPLGEIRGLFVHARAISQILSSVEDKRPLIWVLPQWAETLLIFVASCMGAIVIWYWQSWKIRGLAVGIAIATVYGVCWLVFTQGGWMPLVPLKIAIVVAAGGTIGLYSLGTGSKEGTRDACTRGTLV